MSNTDNELLGIFWEEVGEHLGTLNEALLQVEMAEGASREALLREMNRVAHSMKGAARAVGFSLIETVAHYMEEVFNAILENRLTLSPADADSLYDGLDLIQNVANGDPNDEQVVAQVLQALEKMVTQAAQATSPPQTAASTPATDAMQTPENLKTDSTEMVTVSVRESQEIPSAQADAWVPSSVMPPPLTTSTSEFADVAPTGQFRITEETIRISVGKLDHLMAEASELLVLRMQADLRQDRLAALQGRLARWQRDWRTVRSVYIRLVRQMQAADGELADDLRTLFTFLEANQRQLADANRELTQLAQVLNQDTLQLGTLADELQAGVARLRMMPFETLIGGLHRMVRDLARDFGKQVHFDILGAAVEIDKNVLDALRDPLMHLLRNAMDHGIETPEQRQQVGKDPVGRIHLSVEQRGSEIVLTMRDDGRGLNAQKIKRRALERGLITETEAQTLSDDDLRMLVFQSGFSTSDTVTAVSGRGLGMDIVRDRVESLRGRVSLHSTLGSGTTLTLHVPVSLTRLRCILLRVGEETYAVPSVTVARMETLPRDALFTAEGRPMLTLNERPVPLLSLATLLDVPPISPDEAQVRVLALQAMDRLVAFDVDDLLSELELVLKPLGRELANAPYVAGAALMGTGDVLIILDANELVRQAAGLPLLARRQPTVQPQQAAQRLRVLVVDDSITTRTLEKNILETAGFAVEVAIDGEEAWARLHEVPFDVVISDVEMPNMNGLQLTERIKRTPATQHLPVILLTSLSKPEQREAGLRAGADAYLIKSRFDQGELLQTIYMVV